MSTDHLFNEVLSIVRDARGSVSTEDLIQYMRVDHHITVTWRRMARLRWEAIEYCTRHHIALFTTETR